MWWVIGALVWAMFGVLAYGLTIGYFQWKPEWIYAAQKNRQEHRRVAVNMATLGPVGLMVALSGSDGNPQIKFRSPTKEQSREDARRQFSILMEDPKWVHKMRLD